MNTQGKCLAIFLIFLLVVIVIIIIGNTSSPNGDASRWNSTSHHQGNWTSDGEEVLGAKIGIAPNRGGVGVDRSGRHKTKWEPSG